MILEKRLFWHLSVFGWSKKFSLVIFRTRQEGDTSAEVKSFQSVTLPAVCKLGLVILGAHAVGEERERNRRQEVVLIERVFHLGHISSPLLSAHGASACRFV